MPRAFHATPIAHRGLHDRGRGIVENSRAAATAAIAHGYAIEIDVQRAACGEAMVFHDDTLPRLTGQRGRLADVPAAQLRTFGLTGGGETIPTLSGILELVAGRVPLLIEIKDQTGTLGPEVGPLESRVAELVSAYDGPVALMSFNPHAIAKLAEIAPAIPRGLTTCAFADDEWPLSPSRRQHLAAIRDFDPTGACFISHDRTDLANPAVTALKSRGLPILTWTIRSPDQETAARATADNITFEGYRPDKP